MGRCPKCGTFKKSGKVSCCAPGGAWFKNCGGVGNRNVGYRWLDGVEACKFTISPVCRKCVTIKKSGKMSCCGRGGSWFKKCGSAAAGNRQIEHTWYEGIRACNHADTVINTKGVVLTGNTFVSKPANTPKIQIIIAPVNVSTTASIRMPSASLEYDIDTTKNEAIMITATRMIGSLSNMSIAAPNTFTNSVNASITSPN